MHHLDWAVPRLDAGEWWLLAVVWFGLGDLVTTAVGLGLPGVVESNPAVAALLATASVAALVVVKFAVLGSCYALSRQGPRAGAVAVPVTLTAMGVLVTVWNVHVLLRATLG